tara:strand:+ start:501 stop:902 length:402 start_codon:yes stop_codon:yes gene_type:complete
MSQDIEKFEEVKKFLQSENPSVDVIASAYYKRDQIMNLNFDKEQSLKKLGYTEDRIKSFIKNDFKLKMQNIINNFDQNTIINLEEEYVSYLTSDKIVNMVNFRQNRYNFLNSIDNHLEFYNSMTREELTHLGW